jgi:hypothetical protein
VAAHTAEDVSFVLQLIIPRGAAHSLRNLGTQPSINFSAFGSENPGTGVSFAGAACVAHSIVSRLPIKILGLRRHQPGLPVSAGALNARHIENVAKHSVTPWRVTVRHIQSHEHARCCAQVLSTQLFTFPVAVQTNAFQLPSDKVQAIDGAKGPGENPSH